MSAVEDTAHTLDELCLKRDLAPKRVVGALIRKLAGPEYPAAPFRSRRKSMELVSALMVKFEDQMGRVNRGGGNDPGGAPTGIEMATAEYLLKEARYICCNSVA